MYGTEITKETLREIAESDDYGSFKIEDLIDCMAEEVEICVKTYPRQHARGRLMHERAISKIAKKTAILNLLRRLRDKAKEKPPSTDGPHDDGPIDPYPFGSMKATPVNF